MLRLSAISTVPTRAKLLVMGAVPFALITGAAIAFQKVKFLVPLFLLVLLLLMPVQLSLGVFGFSIPFDNIATLAPGTALSAVAGAFAGGVLLCYGLITGRLQNPPRAALWWGLLVTWTVASMFWAIDSAESMKRLPTIVTIFAVYLVAVSFRISPREFLGVVAFTVAGGLLAALMLVKQFAGDMTLSGRGTLMIGGNQANPNDFASTLILPFTLAMAGMLSASRLRNRVVMLVVMGLIGGAILLTMSRGAMLALAATVLIYMFRAKLRVRMLLPIVIIALPLLFLPNLFFKRWEEAASSRGQGRIDIFIVGGEIIKHYPVFGAGVENFSVAYRQYAGRAAVFRGVDLHAHNTYLQVWAETGIIGLLLLLAALRSQMKVSRYIFSSGGLPDHYIIAAEAACWGMLVMSLSGNIQWNKPFWFCFILLTLALQKRENEKLESLQAPDWAQSVA